jgi:tubulin polyglutamylase TTLL7
VIIDHKFKPYLLEVNCSPSFGTDTLLDYKIKKNVIADAMQMLNFNLAQREESIRLEQERAEERIRTGKTVKLSA